LKAITVQDYGASGLTIREAMLRHAVEFPDTKTRPDLILWNGHQVKTADIFSVPRNGMVWAEFLTSKEGVEQGFDLKVDGWFQLAGGERVPFLRTWNDPRFEAAVEYPYCSEDQRMIVWNVYRMIYPGGQVVEEKWTENAGMWIEQATPHERIYHCSHGMADPPDFESLVFRVSVAS
jgi:hypothetical protein